MTLVIPPILIIIGGATVLALLGFELLVGYRKIKFKGAMHLKAHKWIAWTLLAFAVFHGTAALFFLGVL